MSNSDSDTSEHKGYIKKCSRYECDYCGATFATKGGLQYHVIKCSVNTNRKDKCGWCGLEFYNRGVLAMHATRIHGDNSYKLTNENVKCSVCNAVFHNKESLKYHIRKAHFNLKANIPFAELKKVNQVWFERAVNNKIVEIKKTGPSKLIIKTLSDKTQIRLNDIKPEVVDVSDIYPINRGRIECKVCKKQVSKKDYKKHLKEKHLNLKTHQCNNCKRTFKRTYLYLKHVCTRQMKLRGVKNLHKESQILIASVESLPLP